MYNCLRENDINQSYFTRKQDKFDSVLKNKYFKLIRTIKTIISLSIGVSQLIFGFDNRSHSNGAQFVTETDVVVDD